jgi:hypothetical protein
MLEEFDGGPAMQSRTIVLPLGVFVAVLLAVFTSWEQSLVIAHENGRTESGKAAVSGNDEVAAHPESAEIETLPADDRVLDKEQLKRLRVAWDKPRRFVDIANERTPYLKISGTLSLLQKDGKTLEPVDWPSPIQVVLALKPNRKLDWKRWHDSQDSEWSNTLVGRDCRDLDKPLANRRPGLFTVSIPLGLIESPVGATKPFQVGLCLGEKNGKKVTWTNVVPILPQSVKMLDVTGPKPLSRTLQFINACPTPMGWAYDPIALVRATNHLQSIGKTRAIAALREFTQLAPWGGHGRPRIDPRNIDTANEYCLAGLVPLVFDGVPQDELIRIWQGIPFQTVVFLGATGNTLRAGRDSVEAAAKTGKLRKMPLRPSDNPLEAADALFKKIADPKVRNRERLRDLREHLRKQAWRAIRHLVDPHGKEPTDLSAQATWDKLKTKAAQLKIHWDERRQEYVAGAKLK